MARNTLHRMITREAAAASRRKPLPIIDWTTHHIRYSISGGGRTANTCSHVVDNTTNKSLCGRDASNWFKMEWHAPECSRCKEKAGFRTCWADR